MSNTLHNHHSASIDEQAAIWFSRLCRGLSDDERAQLDAWLTADVAHVHALRTMQGVWAELDLLPRPLLTPVVPRPRQTRRRWMPGRAVAACLVLLGTLLIEPQQWLGAPATQVLSLRSAPNEQRQVELADGSRIDLNVDTRLQVRLQGDRREVELLAGEAFFNVTPDPARPFDVIVGPSRVRVVGTRFNVRRSTGHLSVAVESGRVVVQPQLSDPQHAELDAGEGVAFDYQRHTLQHTHWAADEIASWRRGQLIFRDRPLGQLLDELSQYHRAPIHLSDADLAKKRISGSLNIAQPDAFLAALPQLLPVRVEQQADGHVLIVPLRAQ